MIKPRANKSIEQLQQALSLEETILGPLDTDTDKEQLGKSRNAAKQATKTSFSNSILLDVLGDQAKAKFIWQCVAVTLAVLFAITCVLSFNLYSSRQNLAVKVSILEPLKNDLKESRAQTDQYKSGAIKANAELEHTQNDLDASRAQLDKLQDKLADVTEQLETLKARNAEAVRMLNGRLQKLSDSPDNQHLR